jgi:hypothetical protein
MDERTIGRSFLDDPNVARRFQRRLDEVRPSGGDGRSAPIKYDESGYPVDERPLGLSGRLRRLITG